MITTPPGEHDLHAYMDNALNDAERVQVERYLQAHPEVAAQVQAWQRDAQALRTALNETQLKTPNPALDPSAIRHAMRSHLRRQWATAALLLIALGMGGFGGWQARQATLIASALPMTDALMAHRIFAEQGVLPADYTVQQGQDMQAWVDRYFTDAERLPDLSGAGLRPVSSRLLSTDQGAAAIVLYSDGAGRQISFYIRPPGPHNSLLPRGNRKEDQLQAEYWSGPGYNYAMVGATDALTTQLLNGMGL